MYPKQDDFSWIFQGKHLRPPTIEELSLLGSVKHQVSPQKRRALLLLHGYASSPGVFRHFFPHLGHYDLVYAPLLAGHGQSIAGFAQVSRFDWINQVENILQDLCQNYQHVDVLGLSMGGLLAAYLISRFPVRQLYLLAPAFSLVKPLPVLLKTAEITQALGFSTIANLGGKISNPLEAELSFRQLPLSSIIEVLKLIQDYEYRVWKTPTTLFLGQQDTVVDSAKIAEQLIDIPHLAIQKLKQTNHVLPIDLGYQEILNTINKQAKN